MKNETQAEVFPLDIEALQPGDVLSVARLQQITQHKHGTDAYQHALRHLIRRIEKERTEMQRPLVLRQRKGAIEVCDASMQLTYAQRRAAETSRKLRRTMTVIVTTSVADLTDDEARAYEHLALTTAAKLVVFSRRSPKRIASDPSTGAPAEFAQLKAKLVAKGKKPA